MRIHETYVCAAIAYNIIYYYDGGGVERCSKHDNIIIILLFLSTTRWSGRVPMPGTYFSVLYNITFAVACQKRHHVLYFPSCFVSLFLIRAHKKRYKIFDGRLMDDLVILCIIYLGRRRIYLFYYYYDIYLFV